MIPDRPVRKSMQRILNSNGYGGKILAASGVFGLVIPGLLYLANRGLRTAGLEWPALIEVARVSMWLGAAIFAGLTVLVALELIQDDWLFRRAQREKARGTVILHADGDCECPHCGNRHLRAYEKQCPLCGKEIHDNHLQR